MSSCDSTFMACDNYASVANYQADTDAAPANETDANSTASASTILWGSLVTAQLANGYLMYSDYNTFATSLNTGKTATQTTNWGAAWILTQDPIKYWIYSSYATMGMQACSVMAWGLQMAGMNGLFLNLFTLSLLFPLIEIGASVYAYTKYTTCSAGTSANWVGDTGTTQLVSCAARTSSESFVPANVANDKYQTWLGANAGGALAVLLYSFMVKGAFTEAFSGSSDDSSSSKASSSSSEPADESTPSSESSVEPSTDKDSTEPTEKDWSAGGKDWTSGQNDWGAGNDW